MADASSTCDFCGNPISGRRSHARFCSRTCQRRALERDARIGLSVWRAIRDVIPGMGAGGLLPGAAESGPIGREDRTTGVAVVEGSRAAGGVLVGPEAPQ